MKILVTGATGFIGGALRPALLAAGHCVRATTRKRGHPVSRPEEEWVEADLLEPASVARAMEGVETAYYLVHSMGGGTHDYRTLERRSAEGFVREAGKAGVKRIIYLGGVAPQGASSEHLGSRIEVGQILRSGPVPTLELRASMIIGNGSASWQIVRDLALRLPAMVLPMWLKSRTRPLALEDVVQALVLGLELPLPASAWFDVPGPDTLDGKQILTTIAGLRGRRVPFLQVPLLTPRVSSLWLRLVTRTDFALAKELVMGLATDLLPRDELYWEAVGYRPRLGFEAAARLALGSEPAKTGLMGRMGELEESLVHLFGPKLRGP